MCKVNYIREMEGFGDYAEANRLSGSERLLWMALFRIFNARAFADEWPGGYVEIKNRALEHESGLSRVTVWRAREKLARRGLIDFTLGDGGTLTAYKLHYISVDGAPCPVQIEQGVVQIEQGGVQSEQGGVQSEQGGVQIEQGPSTQYISTEINDTVNNTNVINKEEEDIYNNTESAGAGARGSMYEDAIGESYRETLGRAPSPQEVRDIAEIAAWNGAEGDLVCEAIRRSGAANYPCKYAIKCLMSWGDAGICSREELDVYERYSELASVSRPDIAATGRERLAAFLREIKIKHRMVKSV